MSDEEVKEPIDKKEEFSFIQEQIVQRPRRRVRKFILLVFVIILLAVIFGMVARIVFYVSDPIAVRFLGKEKEKPIVNIPYALPEYTTSKYEEETSEVTTDTTQKEIVTEKIIVEKSDPADINDFKNIYSEISKVVNAINPSIVTVTGVTSSMDWFHNSYENLESTSGIIISNNNEELLVLTYKSKITNVNNIRITFIDNQVVDAKLKSFDKDTDIAVVSVSLEDIPQSTIESIKIAGFGSSRGIKVGMPIIAVGNPNGYAHSFESGFISTINNYAQIEDTNIGLFNTNIFDNKNGSGFIINLDGQIIGIITLQFKNNLNENINTVLAISEVRTLINKLAEAADIAYLGITGSDVTEDISNRMEIPRGIYVTKVSNNSPAFKGGIQSGDIIIKMDETYVISMDDLERVLSISNPKDVMKITVRRTSQSNNSEVELEVILEKKE